MKKSIGERLDELEQGLAACRRGQYPQGALALAAARAHDDVLTGREPITAEQRKRLLTVFHAARVGLEVRRDARGRYRIRGGGDPSLRHVETLAHPGACIHVAGTPARKPPARGKAGATIDAMRKQLDLLEQ